MQHNLMDSVISGSVYYAILCIREHGHHGVTVTIYRLVLKI